MSLSHQLTFPFINDFSVTCIAISHHFTHCRASFRIGINFLKLCCCFINCCNCSVTKLCLILCNHMGCSTLGFPVLHYLPELLKLISIESVMSSTVSSSVSPSSSCLQSFPASGSFPVNQLFASGGQSTVASATACAVISHSVRSDSLGPHGLQSARLLCLWGFSRQEHWSGLPCPPPGDLPNPGIEARSPGLQADSLLSEPPGKSSVLPKNIQD